MSEPAPEAEEIRITARNDRGFHQYGDPVSCSYGTLIDVYESSSAEGPHCWLKLTHGPLMGQGEAFAHLNESQARSVIARLQAWLDEIPSRWEGR